MYSLLYPLGILLGFIMCGILVVYLAMKHTEDIELPKSKPSRHAQIGFSLSEEFHLKIENIGIISEKDPDTILRVLEKIDGKNYILHLIVPENTKTRVKAYINNNANLPDSIIVKWDIP